MSGLTVFFAVMELDANDCVRPHRGCPLSDEREGRILASTRFVGIDHADYFRWPIQLSSRGYENVDRGGILTLCPVHGCELRSLRDDDSCLGVHIDPRRGGWICCLLGRITARPACHERQEEKRPLHGDATEHGVCRTRQSLRSGACVGSLTAHAATSHENSREWPGRQPRGGARRSRVSSTQLVAWTQ